MTLLAVVKAPAAAKPKAILFSLLLLLSVMLPTPMLPEPAAVLKLPSCCQKGCRPNSGVLGSPPYRFPTLKRSVPAPRRCLAAVSVDQNEYQLLVFHGGH